MCGGVEGNPPTLATHGPKFSISRRTGPGLGPAVTAWRQIRPASLGEAQLTELVKQPPDGPDWLHEIKFDGYRMHARIDGGDVRLLTRTGLGWTRKYPPIAAALEIVPVQQASAGRRRSATSGRICPFGLADCNALIHELPRLAEGFEL